MRNLLWIVLAAVAAGCPQAPLSAPLLSAAPAAAPAAGPSAAQPPLWVGLRRSSYGCPAKNTDDAWWADRATAYAAGFPGARPLVVEIISTYQDDGTTHLEFARPADVAGPMPGIRFGPGRVDHERALSLYDRRGVKVLLQFESGSADGAACLDLAWRTFKAHPCLIGFGFDAEWYFTKGSPKEEGRPIPDADARRFMEKVLAFNPDFVLFLKHWDASHMPPAYRHPHLWLVSDSQQFRSRAEWLKDLTGWAETFPKSATGFQFGYPKDQPWWSKERSPPRTLGRALLDKIPGCRCLLWVDFTADQVAFGS
jgi:hypothetical protein